MKFFPLFALVLSLLSGIAIALAFPPWNLEWLIWVGLTPVLAAALLFQIGRLMALASGALFGASFAGLTFYWLIQAGRPVDWAWNVLTLGVAGMAWVFLLNRFVALPALTSTRKERLSPILAGHNPAPEAWQKSVAHLRVAMVAAASWTVLEWARSVLIPGWNTLGAALQNSLPLLQLATVTGWSGLTFVVVFANVIILTSLRRIILEPGRMTWASRFDITSTLAGLFLIATGGFYFLQYKAGKDLKTIGVVTNPTTNFDELLAKSKIDQPVDLWLWPAVKVAPGDYSKFTAIGQDTALVTGVMGNNSNDANGAVIITPGSVKNIWILPRTYPLFQPSSGANGRALNSFNFKDASWVTLLNWEGGDPQLARGAIAKGIQILISIADLPQVPAAGIQQMFLNMRLLTLSLGRPLLFVNPNFSAVTSKSGKIVAKSAGNPETVAGKIEVPFSYDATIYGRYRDWFAIACGAITIVAVFSERLRKKSAP